MAAAANPPFDVSAAAPASVVAKFKAAIALHRELDKSRPETEYEGALRSTLQAMSEACQELDPAYSCSPSPYLTQVMAPHPSAMAKLKEKEKKGSRILGGRKEGSSGGRVGGMVMNVHAIKSKLTAEGGKEVLKSLIGIEVMREGVGGKAVFEALQVRLRQHDGALLYKAVWDPDAPTPALDKTLLAKMVAFQTKDDGPNIPMGMCMWGTGFLVSLLAYLPVGTNFAMHHHLTPARLDITLSPLSSDESSSSPLPIHNLISAASAVAPHIFPDFSLILLQSGPFVGRSAQVFRGVSNLGPVALKYCNKGEEETLAYEAAIYRKLEQHCPTLAVPRFYGLFETVLNGVEMLVIGLEDVGEGLNSWEGLAVADRKSIYRSLQNLHLIGLQHGDFAPRNVCKLEEGGSFSLVDFGDAHMHECGGSSCEELRLAREELGLGSSESEELQV